MQGEVDAAQHAKACEQRLGARSDPPREEDDAEHERADDERELDPDVAADAVAADGEREADGGEDESGGAAEHPLEQHRAGSGTACALVTPSRLVDP